MQRSFILAILMALALAVSLGCDAAKTAAGATDKKGASTSKSKDAAKEPAKEAVPAKATGPAKSAAPAKLGKELVKNGSFEEWKDENPADWNVVEMSGNNFKPVKAAKAADAGAGKASAQIPKAEKEGDFVIAKQDLSKDGVKPGKKVYYSARLKAAAPDQAQVVLHFKKGMKREARDARLLHPGSGKWEKLELNFDVPAEALPDSFIVFVYHRGQAKGDVLVDDVSVRFEE